MRAVRAIAVAAALIGASCGAPLMKLPSGPGGPAADAEALLDEATAACRKVSALTAEIGVSGSVDGQRVRGRLLAGLAKPAVAYLEAPAPFGAPVFIFAAHDGRGTLLLPRDRRVLEDAEPEAILEAVAGVPIKPDDLLAALTGCAPGNAVDTASARTPAPGWRLIEGDYDLYLRQERAGDPWRLVAVIHDAPDGWRADYRNFVDDVPRNVRLTNVGDRRFDLRLELSDLDLDAEIDPATLRPAIPPGTQPITLEELRRNGPLAR